MIWKLLRQHISVAQLAGFFLANLCGMVIVLLSIQFYKDVLPVFTQGDSFMKKDYVIVSKQVSTLGHSKTVLFVNPHQPQRREVDGVFNHGMRTNQDMHIPC